MSRTSNPTSDKAELVPDAERRSRRAAQALRELSELGGVRSIPDPVAWQKEVRKDRPLPGRGE